MEYKVINLIKTRELKYELTKNEESILDFIEKHLEDIPNFSVLELTKVTYSSQGSINRLCKKLGLEGFTHLKLSIKEDLELKKNQGQKQINSISYYVRAIDFNSSIPVIDIIKKNKKLVIYGVGASQITATYLQRQLLYLGYEAILLWEEKMIERFSDSNLLILSSSGETPKIKQAAKRYCEGGKNLISITKKGSSLDQYSTLSFTHSISVDKLDVIRREQQMHMFIMVNEIINNLSKNII